MSLLDSIRLRRSIREYKEVIPGDKQIEAVLEAGRWAPSGLNNQPWKFIVVKDVHTKAKLAQCTEYSEVIEGAPAAICIFLDKKAVYNREKDILAVGACIQNMLLCAHDLELGTCWMGEILNQKKKVQKLFNLNSEYELMAVVTLGVSNEKSPKSSRKALKNIIIKTKSG